MIIVEHLPKAGTVFLYRRNGGPWHKAIVDDGILMTHCGIWLHFPPRYSFQRGAPSYIKHRHVDMDRDEIDATSYFDHTDRTPGHYCQRCRR